MSRSLVCAWAWAGAWLLSGCGDHEFEPPDREAQVEEADSLYSVALFDTVAWPSPEVRGQEGNSVYAVSCRRCHGTLGRGETAYAQERGLEVPSLVRRDWEHNTVEAVRRQVFTGHPRGMPIFGIARLTPRQIDAAAFYILEVLRPDVVEGAGGSDEAG